MIKRILLLLLMLLVGSSLINYSLAVEVTPTPIDYQLPFPGILPDHPLYPFKRWRDGILLSLTRKPVKKTEILLLFADKNTSMGQLLWEKKKYDLSLKSFGEGEQNLLKSVVSLKQFQRENSLPPGLTDKIEIAGRKHGEIISTIATDPQNMSYYQQFQDILSINHQAINQVNSFK